MRTHRVGTVTFGTTLIVTGIIYLINIFAKDFDLQLALRFWPVVFILLGIEVLVGYALTVKREIKFKFDWISVVFTALSVLFAMGIAIANEVLQEHFLEIVFH